MLELDSGGLPVTGDCLKCEGGQVIGRKVKELKGARRSLSVDMDVTKSCDRAGDRVSDPQMTMTGKAGRWYSQVTLDLKLGGRGWT